MCQHRMPQGVQVAGVMHWVASCPVRPQGILSTYCGVHWQVTRYAGAQVLALSPAAWADTLDLRRLRLPMPARIDWTVGPVSEGSESGSPHRQCASGLTAGPRVVGSPLQGPCATQSGSLPSPSMWGLQVVRRPATPPGAATAAAWGRNRTAQLMNASGYFPLDTGYPNQSLVLIEVTSCPSFEWRSAVAPLQATSSRVESRVPSGTRTPRAVLANKKSMCCRIPITILLQDRSHDFKCAGILWYACYMPGVYLLELKEYISCIPRMYQYT
jgi:hypothetical protein